MSLNRVVTAALSVLVVAACASREDAPTVAADPEETSYPCNAEARDKGLCPIDEEGERRWQEVLSAFDGKLEPLGLVADTIECCESTLPVDTRVYAFDVEITSTWEGNPPQLSIYFYVPPSPESVTPSVEFHPGLPPDFQSGDGIVLITRSDGTKIELRLSGAQNVQDPRELNQAAIDLARRAVTTLAR